MKSKHLLISTVILIVITFILMFIKGWHYRGLIDSLFLAAILLLCIALFLLMFADGAYSIMGHNFRRFTFMTSSKRVQETMQDDELYNQKTAVIKKRNIPFALPLLIISLIALTISMILGYML